MMLLLIPIQYQRDKHSAEQQVQASMTQIRDGYMPALAAGIWNFDRERVALSLKGLIQRPFASYAEVTGDMTLSVGRKPRSALQVLYPIRTTDGKHLGNLAVAFDETAIADAAWNNVRSSFVTLSIYTLLLSGLLLWLVQRTITSRLLRLSHFAQGLRLDNLEEGPSLYLERSADELDQLTKNLLDMRNQLATDRDALRRFEQELARKANEDQLTGLPNRFSFLENLYPAMDRQTPFALMFIDLDGFKKVNDSLGHSVGDELLKQTARRLRELTGDSVFLARYGGDEFVLLFPKPQLDGVRLLADKLTAGFSRPFKVSGNLLYLSVSIGIARYPEDADSSEELIKRADVAMYQAKAMGRSRYLFFDQHLYDNMLKKMALEDKLRESVRSKSFQLVYQPIFSVQRQRISYVEALLRWPHASPDRFIPLAEETGLILPLGLWVLEQSLAQLAQWHQQGEKIRLSVNVSTEQLHQHDFAEQVLKRIHEAGVSPVFIQLEITETALLEKPDISLSNIEALREQGVRISLDDFGTGYSSLSHLQLMPIDSLKIDKSFVARISESARDKALFEAVINLAKAMDLEITVEGIESAEQASMAIALQTEYLQGYYFAKPVSASELVLSQHAAPVGGGSALTPGANSGIQ